MNGNQRKTPFEHVIINDMATAVSELWGSMIMQIITVTEQKRETENLCRLLHSSMNMKD